MNRTQNRGFLKPKTRLTCQEIHHGNGTNSLVKTLQNEGNLKYSFSGNEIEILYQWMTIETFKQSEILIKKATLQTALRLL
tara:strand:- start:235 stop:477 length:243 start_codon:yes stop_codon:yes gene_type:complete